MTERLKKTEELLNEILKGCKAVRRLRPLVHMIPNDVTAGLCADVIAAVGGRPVMATAPQEMKEITSFADGLAVNLGQPSEGKFTAGLLAMEAAAAGALPVLFDPVGAGASEYRKNMADCLTELGWSGVIKGNNSEIHTVLTGELAHSGVDSLTEYRDQKAELLFLKKMAGQDRRIVLAVTGARDRILWIDRAGVEMEITLNHCRERPMIMVGTGCAAGAAGAVFLAAARVEKGAALTEREMAFAMAGALSLTAFAGEQKAQSEGGIGYGSYRAVFLDRLSSPAKEEYENWLCGNLRVREYEEKGLFDEDKGNPVRDCGPQPWR